MIYSALKSSGYGHWIDRKTPLLQARHAEEQHTFACELAEWDWEEWEKVIFTDECSVALGAGHQ